MPFSENRCYGNDTRSSHRNGARNVPKGLMDAGCLPVIKHAPGHGRATLDSHADAAAHRRATYRSPNHRFRAVPRAGSDLPMVMTAHIVLPEVDPDTPGYTFARRHWLIFVMCLD